MDTAVNKIKLSFSGKDSRRENFFFQKKKNLLHWKRSFWAWAEREKEILLLFSSDLFFTRSFKSWYKVYQFRNRIYEMSTISLTVSLILNTISFNPDRPTDFKKPCSICLQQVH